MLLAVARASTVVWLREAITARVSPRRTVYLDADAPPAIASPSTTPSTRSRRRRCADRSRRGRPPGRGRVPAVLSALGACGAGALGPRPRLSAQPLGRPFGVLSLAVNICHTSNSSNKCVPVLVHRPPPLGSYTRVPVPLVYAVANQKGGVAKTTTVHALGAAFVEQGLRVLL